MYAVGLGKKEVVVTGRFWVKVFEDGALWAMREVSGDAVGLDLYLAGVRPPAGIRNQATGWPRIRKSFDFSTSQRTYEDRRIDFYKKSISLVPENQLITHKRLRYVKNTCAETRKL
jgi:hypothetical protein